MPASMNKFFGLLTLTAIAFAFFLIADQLMRLTVTFLLG
jgi:hypothetical protein